VANEQTIQRRKDDNVKAKANIRKQIHKSAYVDWNIRIVAGTSGITLL
jgi:hypothetical protein